MMARSIKAQGTSTKALTATVSRESVNYEQYRKYKTHA